MKNASWILLTMISISVSQNQWTIINPIPTMNDLIDITFGNGMYVAVGDIGTIITSPDGIEWSIQSSGVTSKLNDVYFGNKTFIAVGDSGTILTSIDGIDWSKRDAGTTRILYSTIFGDNQFVCSGDSGKIISSDDGSTWTNCSTGTTARLTSISYGSGRYVAVSSGFIFYTSDWINWGTSSTSFYAYSVVYGNGLFIASGGQMHTTRPMFLAAVTFTSTDGITWTNSFNRGGNYLTRISYEDNHYVAAGLGLVISSADGKIWNINAEKFRMDFNAGVFCSNQIVAVGNKGIVVRIYNEVSSIRKKKREDARINSVLIGKEIGSNSNISILLPVSLQGQSISVSIYSASGKLITKKNFIKGQMRNRIPIAGFSTGIYIITLTVNNKTISSNFVLPY